MAAKRVASSISFELIETTYALLPNAQKRLRPILRNREEKELDLEQIRLKQNLQDYLPEQLILLILKHCFPESSENIRLYRFLE